MDISVGTGFWCMVDKTDSCWNWLGARSHFGHGTHGKMLAHRLSWQATHGAIPEGLKVLHTCDNPKCVNPKHLFLGTQADNVRDMVSKGRQAKGSKNGASKLTENTVKEARELYKVGGQTTYSLAKLFGISTTAMWSALNYVTWKEA